MRLHTLRNWTIFGSLSLSLVSSIACGEVQDAVPAAGAAGGGAGGGSAIGPAEGGETSSGGEAGSEAEGGSGGANQCNSDFQCAPMICEEGSCVEAECTAEEDCSGDDVCMQGRCQVNNCTVEITFTYTPGVIVPTNVFVAGTFNAWDATGTRLEENDAGDFTGTVLLMPGMYEYKFVIDGTWVTDDANPRSVNDNMGGLNSILLTNCDGAILAECLEDEACDGGEICEELACVPAECNDANDCEEPYCVDSRCSDSPCQPVTEFVYVPPGAQPLSVNLAGTFNSWSPTSEPLTKQDDGSWTVTIDTLANEQTYEYKFVVIATVGGEAAWVFDDENERRNADNSLALISCDGLVLPECTEDEECTDEVCEEYLCVAPECSEADPCTGEDEDCIAGRCVAGCIPPAEFVYTPPGAAPTAVHLAGSFNGWSSTAEPLTEQLNGDWTVTLDDLDDGESYEYKFVVLEADGTTTNWVVDTNNLRKNGDNSLALISCDGIVLPECVDDAGCADQICVDYLCVAPECVETVDCGSANLECDAGHCVAATCDHTFTYAGDATTVYVAGSFNGWNSTAWALTEVATDTWEGAFPLTAVSHEYKLVVDGDNWILDPANPDPPQNGNSLLVHDCSGAAGAGGGGG
jgi:hypothetical protein